MSRITLTILAIASLISCEKEALHDNNLVRSEASIHTIDLKTPEDVFSFLAREMPEQYDQDEIGRIKQLLSNNPATEILKRSTTTVELPEGSVNAMQAAVAEAGPGGTVLIKAGVHTEDELIQIDHQINIIGETGAQINLGNPVLLGPPIQVGGGIHLKNANGSKIKNIHFSGGSGAGFGLFIEDSDRVLISQNRFTNIQFSILVNYADHISIRENIIDQQIPELLEGARGMIIINGKSASIVQNMVSGTLFGIWACDKGGISWGNVTNGNFYGQIVCKFPAALLNEDGEIVGSNAPGNHWLVAMNESSNNLYAGYVVIDGANKNTLLANRGSGNAAYDIDLVGDSERFGFLTPTSVKNRVWSFKEQIIKDCGQDNKIVGGIHVDTSADPCL